AVPGDKYQQVVLGEALTYTWGRRSRRRAGRLKRLLDVHGVVVQVDQRRAPVLIHVIRARPDHGEMAQELHDQRVRGAGRDVARRRAELEGRLGRVVGRQVVDIVGYRIDVSPPADLAGLRIHGIALAQILESVAEASAPGAVAVVQAGIEDGPERARRR